MLKNNILLYLVLYFLTSCNNFNWMNGSDPGKRSFKYYNKNFKLDTNSKLKTNIKYVFKMDSLDKFRTLIFFSNGFLNKYFTKGLNGIDPQRPEARNIMGYYMTRKDSIFFTTKSYYQQFRATYYIGRINGDTLELEVKYPGDKQVVHEKYILYP